MTSNLKLKKLKKIKSQFFGTIVIVSKKRSTEEILFYYKNGHRDFGENRVEELITKKELLELQNDYWSDYLSDLNKSISYKHSRKQPKIL